MLASDLLTVLFAAGAVAAPLAKPDAPGVTTVIKHLTYDQNGNLLNEQLEVVKPKADEAAPAAPAPQPVTANKQLPKDPAVPVTKPQPQGAVNQLAQGGTSDQDGSIPDGAKYVGWVDNTNPIFKTMALWHHNQHRANASVDPLEYDDTLAQAAQAWAEKCIGEEEIPEGSGYGMNVGFSGDDDQYNPSHFISGGWYNSEVEKFPGYGNPNLSTGEGSDFGNWGHYSQVVWPDSQKLGCGIAKCPGDAKWKIHSGCMYYPAGNIMGSFDKVKRPSKGMPILYPNGHDRM